MTFAAIDSALGPIDLRLHVEDDAGNAVDYVLSPALFVASDRRRHAAGR